MGIFDKLFGGGGEKEAEFDAGEMPMSEAIPFIIGMLRNQVPHLDEHLDNLARTQGKDRDTVLREVIIKVQNAPEHQEDRDNLVGVAMAVMVELGFEEQLGDLDDTGEAGQVIDALSGLETGNVEQGLEKAKDELRRKGKGLFGRQQTIKNEQPKVGRNHPCPCGSGKKFKNCGQRGLCPKPENDE